eukprot:scaffold175140_cov18-Prasinocladus_malaysianus.AAC.1
MLARHPPSLVCQLQANASLRLKSELLKLKSMMMMTMSNTVEIELFARRDNAATITNHQKMHARHRPSVVPPYAYKVLLTMITTEIKSFAR